MDYKKPKRIFEDSGTVDSKMSYKRGRNNFPK